MNEKAKKMMDAINELLSTGLILVSTDFRDRSCGGDKKLANPYLDKAHGTVRLTIHSEMTDEELSTAIALSYNLIKEAEEIYLYRIKNPNTVESLINMIDTRCRKNIYNK